MTLFDAVLLAVYVVGWFVAVRLARRYITEDPDSLEDGLFIPVLFGLLWPVCGVFAAAYFIAKAAVAVATVPLPTLIRRRATADQERIRELEHELGMVNGDRFPQPSAADLNASHVRSYLDTGGAEDA